MSDVSRAYRRWRLHRLAALLPVFLAAVATQFLVAMDHGASAWLRVLSLGASGLVLVLVGALVGQVLLISRHRARRDPAAARLLRSQIDASRRSAPAAAFLLVVLNVAPLLAPASPAPRPMPPLAPLARLRPADFRPPVPERIDEAPRIPAVSESRPEPPRAPEVLDGLPISIAAEPRISTTVSFRPPQEPPAGAAPENDDGFPRFRPGADDPLAAELDVRVVFSLDRPGLPREGETPPPEVRIDFSLLDGSGRGSELSLLLDVPLGPDESLRTSIALGRVSDGENFLSDSPQIAWDRVTIAYQRRLVGYTRQAPFDLAVSVGLSLERFERGETTSSSMSPYIGLDAALWQHGPAGLLIHAGYSVPIDVGGASSGLLDVSASVRIDLSETLSIQAGYRYLLHRRDSDTSAGSDSGIDEWDKYTGPILSITLRF